MNAAKPIAKSLHTVTVLVQVARAMRGTVRLPLDVLADNVQAQAAYLAAALDVLELADKPDTYGLADAALKQLLKR